MQTYNLLTSVIPDWDASKPTALRTTSPASQKRKTASPNSRYMKLSEAARLSGFSRETIKRYTSNPTAGIVFATLSGYWYIDRKSFQAFLDRIKIQVRGPRRGRMGRPKVFEG